MIQVSDGFLKCCREGGTRISYIDTVDDDLNVGTRLPVDAGVVNAGMNDAIERSFSATVYSATDDFIPRNEESIIHVLGNQAQVWSGWMVDGEPEVVSLGVFVLNGVNVRQEGDSFEIAISGLDRASRVQRASYSPVALGDSFTVVAAIKKLVRVMYPNVEFEMPDDDGSALGNLLFQSNTDLWAEAQNIASTAGMRLSFDNLGRCVMQGPHRDKLAAREIKFFDEYPVSAISRGLDTDSFYNGVIVYGSHTNGSGVVGDAWIEDPQNPYRAAGKIGSRPKVIDSPLVTTQAQANNMARLELEKLVTIADHVTLSVIPNPALTMGDPFMANHEASGTEQSFYLTGYAIPLAASEDMTVTGGRML